MTRLQRNPIVFHIIYNCQQNNNDNLEYHSRIYLFWKVLWICAWCEAKLQRIALIRSQSVSCINSFFLHRGNLEILLLGIIWGEGKIRTRTFEWSNALPPIHSHGLYYHNFQLRKFFFFSPLCHRLKFEETEVKPRLNC